jgi:hypothetical protein
MGGFLRHAIDEFAANFGVQGAPIAGVPRSRKGYKDFFMSIKK